jgi:hypothetical protein
MERSVAWGAWATIGLLLALPAAPAVHDLSVETIRVKDLNGKFLSSPAKGSFVAVIVTVVADNATAPHTGPVTINLTITSPTGVNVLQSRIVNPNRTMNATTDATYDWRPSELGKHVLKAVIGNSTIAAQREIEVRESPTPEGNIVERMLDNIYVFIAFIASTVLFIVVASARRQP